MKNRKKQQKTVVPPRPSEVKPEPEIEAEVADQSQEDNELIRMLREAAVAAEAQKREKEMQEQQKRAAEEAELRRKEKAEREKKALLLRAEKEREFAKMQATKKKVESVVVEPENTTLADLDLIDVDEARRAFVAAEIFNKKYY
jgi:colicin import membrane protein